MKTLNIISFFVVCLFSFTSLSADTVKTPKKGDGRLSLFSYHLKEYIEVEYRNDGKYDKEALAKIENVFRSRDGKSHKIDINLIEMLDQIQDHFNAETVEIISGYRSKAFNNMLRADGRGAASESLHTKGLAADIHLDEIHEEELFDYAKSLKIGGAGLYPRYAFIHVDTGPVRTWGEKAWPKRILVGTENNPNLTWTAVTDKNIYDRGNSLDVVITNNGYEKQKFTTKSMWLERFKKGRWSEHERIQVRGGGKRLNVGEKTNVGWTIPHTQSYGKYRLVIFPNKSKGDSPMYSNEFYIKK
ncbi:MAG: YcbK family protein [Deltaproteobacteria bacterium]|jgi:uncharacterized protein YcbK (DUF882 family)|nr:YcbK family protein [Deltaproteobacteria bacterium]